MVNWNKVWIWTKRILWIIAIIFLAIAFLGFYPKISEIRLFPNYENLIWFIFFLALGLMIIVPLVSRSVVKKVKLRNAVLKSLNRNIKINDKELAAEIDEPLWSVSPLFKKLASEKGLLVTLSGSPTYFHSNFIDQFIKLYEKYGDLGKISKEYAQKKSLNISKEDLNIIIDELIYLDNEKIINLVEKWKKETTKKVVEEKKPSKAIIRRLGDTRRKKK